MISSSDRISRSSDSKTPPGDKSSGENSSRNILLNTILELTDDVVVVIDKNGLIIEASKACQDITGIPLDQMIGKLTWDIFVHDDEKERIKGYFVARGRGVGNPPITYTLRLKGGGTETRFMRAKVSFIPGSANRVVILRDLSEVVEEKLRTAESEERYRKVVENTLDGILICTLEKILFVNSSFCRMTGFQREDIYMMSPSEFIGSGDRNAFQYLITDPAGEKERKSLFETELLGSDSSVHVEMSSTELTYRGTEALLISVRDISRRKKTEKELRDNHDLLKAIVDKSPVGVSVHDRYGTLLMVNESWRKIWGKTLEDIKENMIPREKFQMDRSDTYLGEHKKEVENIYREGGELYLPILKVTAPPMEGAEYISHHFYAIMSDSGDVEKVVILTLDLTESLKMEHSLEETRLRYRDLFTNIPVAVYRTTIESGGRILSANPEMIRMFRAESETDFTDVSVADLYADPSVRRGLMDRLSDKGEVFSFEAELRRFDGSTFLASISARKIRGLPEGGDYIEGIIRDVTNQKRIEEEMQKVEHLESIGTLAGGIAHDFNNILMSIQGNISLAREQEDVSSVMKKLDQADTSLEEAAVLTRQLLTFSRGGEPRRVLVDVCDCVREAVDLALSGSDVEPVYHCEEDMKTIYVDRDQISQVFSNIAMNGNQAMPGGGTLTIESGTEKLEFGNQLNLSPGEYVVISISDSGEGISAEDQRKIFNPYFTTKENGSGLGLPTSFSIVTRHRGAIRVISEKGEGSEFIVYLPLEDNSEEQAEEKIQTEDPKSIPPIRVLIMDDDEKVRDVLKGMLEVLGHRAEESPDGKTAIQMYRDAMEADPFDIVIMDLTIPGGMGGEEAIKKLKEIDPDVRSIVSSGYSSNPVISEYAEYGFAESLMKPYNILTLKRRIETVLSN